MPGGRKTPALCQGRQCMVDAKHIRDEALSHDIPVMKDDGMQFLLHYIEEHENIRDILEAGTAVGYSAIQMALIRWDMTIDTIEVDEQMYAQAKANIEAMNLSSRIHCHLMDAVDFETDKIYDLVFIDAAKSQYQRYLEHFLRFARRGTTFIFDNLGFHGIVDDPSLTHNRSTRQMTAKIRHFRDRLLEDDRFETSYHGQIGDGIAVCVYKGSF